MKIITMVIFLASLFGACEKKPMEDPEPLMEEKEVFEIEWATRLDNEKTIVNHNNGVVYNGEYIYFGDIDEPSRIYAFDIISGNKKWEYSYEGWDDSDVQKNYSIENILYHFCYNISLIMCILWYGKNIKISGFTKC